LIKSIEEEVKEFLVNNGLIKKNSFTLDKTLNELGLDGDDALEFMSAYADKFNVDMSNFDYGKHFGPDSGFFNPISFLSFIFFRKINLVPISIEKLIIAAKNGKWFEED